jgi:hypothetical protein
MGLLVGSGCSPTKYSVDHVMVPLLGNSRDAAFSSNDVRTFRDAAASNLFLLEGMIRTSPDNEELRLNASMLYFSYAFAFIEDTDPDYASLLYEKGRDHAYAVVTRNRKMPAQPDVAFDTFEAALPELREKDVPGAVWVAVNWAQYISQHLDSTAILRDIPKVTSLLDRVVELDPTYFEGMVYVTLGSLHAFKPPIMGGDPEASEASFQNAFAITGDSFLLSRYMYARFYAYRMQDVELFEETLNKVIALELPEDDPNRLLNLIAKDKSRSLLEESDELF